jgi:hypothetical protein
MTDAGVRALALSPHVRGLKQLDLGCEPSFLVRALQTETDRVTDAGVRALAGAPSLAGLRYLSLQGHRITDDGARAIAESPHLAQLGHLNLRDTGVGAEAKKVLRQRYGPGVCTFSAP